MAEKMNRLARLVRLRAIAWQRVISASADHDESIKRLDEMRKRRKQCQHVWALLHCEAMVENGFDPIAMGC
jgi:hypothetical protein